MNWNQVEAKWKEVRSKAQSQWGKLTNDDLDVINGRRTEIESRLQKHHGYAKERVKAEVP